MTQIFISHSHSDREIAEKLVDFLLFALEIEEKDLLCTSVEGHQLIFGVSVDQQLKTYLNETIGLIALITPDSLRSNWVLFELGSSWVMSKLVIPILGPGINYEQLPGPLKNYPGVRIEDPSCSYQLTEVINQLAKNLSIAQKTSAKRDVKKDRFLEALRQWQSKRTDSDPVSEGQELTKKVQELTNELEQSQKSYDQIQQEKLDLEKFYQSETKKLQQQLEQERLITSQKDRDLERILQEKLYLEKSNQATLETLKQEQLKASEQLKIVESLRIHIALQSSIISELQKSEKEINYSKLEELLKQQQWREADKETYICMITILGKKDGDYFSKEDINNFPCEDLRTIDQLWVKYSNGRFGFSVQKNIWLEVGGKVNYDTEKKLGDRVGWYKGGEWINYNSLQFNLSAPPGHLPVGGLGWLGWGVGVSVRSSLAQRLVTCRI